MYGLRRHAAWLRVTSAHLCISSLRFLYLRRYPVAARTIHKTAGSVSIIAGIRTGLGSMHRPGIQFAVWRSALEVLGSMDLGVALGRRMKQVVTKARAGVDEAWT